MSKKQVFTQFGCVCCRVCFQWGVVWESFAWRHVKRTLEFHNRRREWVRYGDNHPAKHSKVAPFNATRVLFASDRNGNSDRLKYVFLFFYDHCILHTHHVWPSQMLSTPTLVYLLCDGLNTSKIMHPVLALSCVFSKGRFYPYPSGSPHRHWDNFMIGGYNWEKYAQMNHISPMRTDNITTTKRSELWMWASFTGY